MKLLFLLLVVALAAAGAALATLPRNRQRYELATPAPATEGQLGAVQAALSTAEQEVEPFDRRAEPESDPFEELLERILRLEDENLELQGQNEDLAAHVARLEQELQAQAIETAFRNDPLAEFFSEEELKELVNASQELGRLLSYEEAVQYLKVRKEFSPKLEHWRKRYRALEATGISLGAPDPEMKSLIKEHDQLCQWEEDQLFLIFGPESKKFDE